MGKSTSCFKLITCGGDAAEKDDYHQVSEVTYLNSMLQLTLTHSYYVWQPLMCVSACVIRGCLSSSCQINGLGLSSAYCIDDSVASCWISVIPFFNFFWIA